MSHISEAEFGKLKNVIHHYFDEAVCKATALYGNDGVKRNTTVTAMDKNVVQCDIVAFPYLTGLDYINKYGIGYQYQQDGTVKMCAEVYRREREVEIFNTQVQNIYSTLCQFDAFRQSTMGRAQCSYEPQVNGSVDFVVRLP